MRRKILVVLLVAALCAVSALGETTLCAVNVGKGDALIVRYDDYVCLIDTGKPYARGRILKALEEMGVTGLDAVFLTHVDSDHAGGLEWLSQSGISVGAWYASPFYFEYKESKHPLNKLGLEVSWLSAGDVVQICEGASFTVLAPLARDANEENDNSLVMLLETPDGRMLLTGDMELPEEALLLGSGAAVDCDILKVPNHGDGDACGNEFALRCGADIAVISTDSYEAPDTPDSRVLNALAAAGSSVYITQEHSAVIAVLSEGVASASYADWDAGGPYSVQLDVNADDEIMTITNTGMDEIDMENWYLYSERGDEMAVLHDLKLQAGASVRVGTLSSPEGGYDVLWNEKNVISNKKSDAMILYDDCGKQTARRD